MSKKRDAAKKTAWKNFSRYIRLKECILTTGSSDFGKCCDCGKIYEYDKLDAGHFVPGRGDSILFVENNVHIQCHSCNRFKPTRENAKAGISPGYLLYMLDHYGTKEVERLVLLKYQACKMTEQDFRDISKKYLAKTSELER